MAPARRPDRSAAGRPQRRPAATRVQRPRPRPAPAQPEAGRCGRGGDATAADRGAQRTADLHPHIRDRGACTDLAGGGDGQDGVHGGGKRDARSLYRSSRAHPFAGLAGVVRGNLTRLQATAVSDRWGTTHYSVCL
jgi:hypothetical protein